MAVIVNPSWVHRIGKVAESIIIQLRLSSKLREHLHKPWHLTPCQPKSRPPPPLLLCPVSEHDVKWHILCLFEFHQTLNQLLDFSSNVVVWKDSSCVVFKIATGVNLRSSPLHLSLYVISLSILPRPIQFFSLLHCHGIQTPKPLNAIIPSNGVFFFFFFFAHIATEIPTLHRN